MSPLSIRKASSDPIGSAMLCGPWGWGFHDLKLDAEALGEVLIE
jgi:hypothetical protein